MLNQLINVLASLIRIDTIGLIIGILIIVLLIPVVSAVIDYWNSF